MMTGIRYERRDAAALKGVGESVRGSTDLWHGCGGHGYGILLTLVEVATIFA